MSENDTDIEDLPPADLGTDLEDLDMGADLSDADLPDLEASDDLLDPFVGDSLEDEGPLNGADEQTLDDLPPDPGMLDDGPLLDDLEPDHLEEELPEAAAAPDAHEEQNEIEAEGGPDDEDDLEPITLSEEELDNILGTGEDVLVDLADQDPDADGPPENEDDFADLEPAPVTGEAPEEEDFDVDLEAAGQESDFDLDAGLDDISDETLTPLEEETATEELGEEPVIMDDLPDEISDDLGEAPEAPPAEDEEEGPVALSEAELDNILGDVDMSEPMDLGATPDDFSDVPDDMGAEPAAEMEPEPAAEEPAVDLSDDEEDITLSDDELSNVLLDTEELAETPAPAEEVLDDFPDDDLGGDLGDDLDQDLGEGLGDTLGDGLGDDFGDEPLDLDEPAAEEFSAEEPAAEEVGSILDEDDDDEPVTLSMEELGNIVSDVDTEEAEDAVGLPAEQDVDLAEEEPAVAPDDTPSILDEDEDEGPVALSEDELSNILEDVDEEQAEDIAAPMAEAIEEKNIIVLDEYEELGEPEGDQAALSDAELEAELDLESEPEGEVEPEPAPAEPDRAALVASTAAEQHVDPGEVKKMISYLDRLFDQLPEDTIREFSKSEYFDLYKKIMGDLGLLKE